MPENRKATFVLPERLLDEIKALVQGGRAESISAFVREGLEANLRRYREEAVRLEYKMAAMDPDFLRDISEVMSDFEAADAETASLIKPDPHCVKAATRPSLRCLGRG